VSYSWEIKVIEPLHTR